VNELADVFEKDYGFDVHKRTVGVNQKTQHQMNHHNTEYVLNHDEKNSLLIVYYAGHGVNLDHKLMLVGLVHRGPDDIHGKYLTSWQKCVSKRAIPREREGQYDCLNFS
jgi:hypothetical protein